MINFAMGKVKERLIGITGSISGTASVLGSWQVCHNICLGLIALLGILGITVAGMPLVFLTKVAVPFWILAFSFLLITLFMYYRKKCISHKLIIFNSGLIVAGIPFPGVQQFSVFFWVAGGLLVIVSVFLFVRDRIKKKKCEAC